VTRPCQVVLPKLLGGSQFVAWVGATCVPYGHPFARLGEFHLSVQRQSAKPPHVVPRIKVAFTLRVKYRGQLHAA
jgi:hypothetical protein